MPYYLKKNILFIHIPKTGGTTLENFLQKNDKQLLYSGISNNILPELHLKRKSLQHQRLSDIIKYQKLLNIKIDEKTKIITIVRNPYTRIISDLFWYKLIKKEDNPITVFKVMIKYLKNDKYDNHNKPQNYFLLDKNNILNKNIIIFKKENLNNDFNKFMNKNFNLKPKLINCNINKLNEKNYFKYLNKNSLNLINKFYRNDFKIFNYKMIKL